MRREKKVYDQNYGIREGYYRTGREKRRLTLEAEGKQSKNQIEKDRVSGEGSEGCKEEIAL